MNTEGQTLFKEKQASASTSARAQPSGGLLLHSPRIRVGIAQTANSSPLFPLSYPSRSTRTFGKTTACPRRDRSIALFKQVLRDVRRLDYGRMTGKPEVIRPDSQFLVCRQLVQSEAAYGIPRHGKLRQLNLNSGASLLANPSHDECDVVLLFAWIELAKVGDKRVNHG